MVFVAENGTYSARCFNVLQQKHNKTYLSSVIIQYLAKYCKRLQQICERPLRNSFLKKSLASARRLFALVVLFKQIIHVVVGVEILAGGKFQNFIGVLA